MTLAPKPKPVLSGSSTNCGIRMNELYIPKPISSVARLTVQTPRTTIIFMSTSGSLERDSARTQAASSTSPIANRPITLGEVQPQVGAWLKPSRMATSQPDRSDAPSQFTRPGLRTGDSGTNSHVATSASSTATSGIQKR